METFIGLCNAVQENNRINGGQWKDWENARHIQQCYGDLKCEHIEAANTFLNALIRDNGENIMIYISCMDCLEYGLPLSRNEI